MMDTILFIRTYEDYHANGANRSYWSKIFKSLTKELNEESKMRLYTSFNENMPIYEYYSEVKERFVRIMQYNPKDEDVLSEKYTANRYYTAWIDERALCIKEQVVLRPELVICLLMTAQNIERSEKLIRSWLFEKDEMTQREIEKIYAEQEKMDKENK